MCGTTVFHDLIQCATKRDRTLSHVQMTMNVRHDSFVTMNVRHDSFVGVPGTMIFKMCAVTGDTTHSDVLSLQRYSLLVVFFAYTHAHIHTRALPTQPIYTCTYEYICTCVYIYIYVYIYIHKHTHTHTHTYLRTRTCIYAPVSSAPLLSSRPTRSNTPYTHT